jgi:hypothetical protein
MVNVPVRASGEEGGKNDLALGFALGFAFGLPILSGDICAEVVEPEGEYMPLSIPPPAIPLGGGDGTLPSEPLSFAAQNSSSTAMRNNI